jgi:hypothetical protein
VARLLEREKAFARTEHVLREGRADRGPTP